MNKLQHVGWGTVYLHGPNPPVCMSKWGLRRYFWLSGVISYTLSLILGIVSLPSVTASLTWKEFAFVQSKLGWICLLVAIVHNVSYGWKYLFTPSCYIPSSFQVNLRRFWQFMSEETFLSPLTITLLWRGQNNLHLAAQDAQHLAPYRRALLWPTVARAKHLLL